MIDLFLTNTQLLVSKDVNWWTGVVWITCRYLFGLSFWRHPFTAEDPLVRKWWNATVLQIWWRNKLIYILDGLRVSTSVALFFDQTIPLISHPCNWLYNIYIHLHNCKCTDTVYTISEIHAPRSFTSVKSCICLGHRTNV